MTVSFISVFTCCRPMFNSDKRDGPINKAPVDSLGINVSISFGPEIHEATERRRPPSYAEVLTARTSIARLCPLASPVMRELILRSNLSILLAAVPVRRCVAANCTQTAPCRATCLSSTQASLAEGDKDVPVSLNHVCCVCSANNMGSWRSSGCIGLVFEIRTCDSARCPMAGIQGANVRQPNYPQHAHTATSINPPFNDV